MIIQHAQCGRATPLWHNLGSGLCRSRSRHHAARLGDNCLPLPSLRCSAWRKHQGRHWRTARAPVWYVQRKGRIHAHLHSALLWWQRNRRCSGTARRWHFTCYAVFRSKSRNLHHVRRWRGEPGPGLRVFQHGKLALLPIIHSINLSYVIPLLRRSSGTFLASSFAKITSTEWARPRSVHQ